MPCKQDSGQKILTNTLPQFIQSHTSFFFSPRFFQRNDSLVLFEAEDVT